MLRRRRRRRRLCFCAVMRRFISDKAARARCALGQLSIMLQLRSARCPASQSLHQHLLRLLLLLLTASHITRAASVVLYWHALMDAGGVRSATCVRDYSTEWCRETRQSSLDADSLRSELTNLITRSSTYRLQRNSLGVGWQVTKYCFSIRNYIIILSCL